jgi:hypothetical protein
MAENTFEQSKARRPYRSGYIRQRGKNSWQLMFYRGKDPKTGKYRQLTETVRGSREDAEKRLQELVTTNVQTHSEKLGEIRRFYQNQINELNQQAQRDLKRIEDLKDEIADMGKRPIDYSRFMQLKPNEQLRKKTGYRPER